MQSLTQINSSNTILFFFFTGDKCNLATALFRNVYDKKFNICQQSICKHEREQTIPSLEISALAVETIFCSSLEI